MRIRRLTSGLLLAFWTSAAVAQAPPPDASEPPTPQAPSAEPPAKAPGGEKGAEERAPDAAPTAPADAGPDRAAPEPSGPDAQPAPATDAPAQTEPPAGAEQKPEQPPEAEPGEEPPALRAPSLQPPAVAPLLEAEAEPRPGARAKEAGAVPSPADAGDRLSKAAPEVAEHRDVIETAPQPVITLHGYMRVRGELQDTFWLGRKYPEAPDEGEPDPFYRFIPLERHDRPAGGCGDEDETSQGGCDIDTLQFANMRLRLAPQLNLSDDVRVKTRFDLLDNMVAGTSPATFYGSPPLATVETLSSTDLPPESNGMGDSIVVRNAWAEVRNRSLGELRFGRMPQHWGLGILNNAGNGLDDDVSSDIDRLMGITKIAGIYLTASYDFIASGLLQPNYSSGLMSDVSQLDDVDQFTFTVARRLDPEEQESILERGRVALNGGLYFSYRVQDMYTTRPDDPINDTDPPEPLLALIDAETFTLDAWTEFQWSGLRLELEAALTLGTIGNIDAAPDDEASTSEDYDLAQLGAAFELEYRLVDDRLGLHFITGLATGDADAEGLSSRDDVITQVRGGDNVTTFRFHPSYRVDLILWRTILGQVTGAYYFRPGINYDFVRDPFGQLFGARLDVIISRASAAEQTWGDDADTGVEINASLYWRSEHGPEPIDGYHAMIQWGLLFPMSGLADPPGTDDEDRTTSSDLEYPQALRLLMGVVF